MQPVLTAHARARMQQRGIAPEALEELLDLGRETFDHRGHATILYFGAEARRRLGRRRARLYAVLSHDGEVITVGWRRRRIARS